MLMLMKRVFNIIAVIASFAVAEAATVEVTLPAAGTLRDYITPEQQKTITELKVSGDINGDDIRILRNMIGSRVTNAIPSNVEVDSGACRYLDLSDANIVAGGCYSLSYAEHPTEGPPYYLPGYEVKDNTIDYLMFCGSKIETLILPKSVTSIGNTIWFFPLDLYDYPDVEPFIYHCVNGSNLRSVTLPDNLESFNICGIGKAMKHRDKGPDYYADIFQTNLFDSPNLQEINISDGNQYFKTIDGVLYNADLSELLFCPAKLNKPFALPEQTKAIGQRACNNLIVPGTLTLDVEKIGMDAFRGAAIQEGLILGEGVEEIGFAAFYGSSIPSLTILGNPTFATQPFFVELSSYIVYSFHTDEPHFQNYERKASLAFAYCKDMKTLKMPDINRIEEATFYGTDLKCLNLVEMPNLSHIGDFAFYDCSLNELILTPPADITDIYMGKGAFSRKDTSKRRSIYVPESQTIPDNTATPNDYIYLWISDETIDNLTKSTFDWASYCINYTEVSGYYTTYHGLGPDEKPGDGYLFLPKGMRLKAIERMQTLKHSEPGRYKSNLYAFIPYENYIEVDMGEFPNAISSVPENSVNTDAIEIARYDINGRCLRGPQPGLNIVRYSDGTVKKEFTR